MNHAARIITTLVASAGFLMALTGTALAQKYPSRAIRVIIPQLPGDPCDVFARVMGPHISERLGQQLVVDNRPGAGGVIGLDLAAKAPADGYTIACGQGGNLSVIPHTMKNVPYKALQDFAPIALVATNYLALVAYPGAPFKTTAELIKHLKANPGKVTFATNGQGAFLHMATESFRSAVGFEYIHVPFKGVSAMAQEIMAGRVDTAFSSFTGIYPFIKSGQVRLLGIAKPTRAANYPDLPTIAETVPGFSSGGWFGFVAPAKVSKEIITILNREMNAALKLPDVRAKLETLGLDVWTESPEYLGQMMKSEYDKYAKVARDIKLVPQ